jgi:hypothetical protein
MGEPCPALLTMHDFESGFGPQNFSDPKEPSSLESVIIRPDKKAKGGSSVVREAQAAEETKAFKRQ